MCKCEHDFLLCCMHAISMSAVALLAARCLLHAFYQGALTPACHQHVCCCIACCLLHAWY